MIGMYGKKGIKQSVRQEKEEEEIIDIVIGRYIDRKCVNIKVSDLIKKKENLKDDIFSEILNSHYTEKTGKYKDLMFQVISNCKGFDNLDDDTIKYMTANLQFNLVLQKLIELGKNIPDDCFPIAIVNNNYELIEFMIDKMNIKCTNIHLELACEYSDIKTMSYILQQKVIPTQKSFRSIINKNSKYLYNKFFGISHSKKKIHELNNIPKLKLLCDYGYIIKQEDFVSMLTKRKYIKNYEKYKLELTDEVKKTCNESLFYPYEETKMTIYGYKQLLNKKVNLGDLKKIEKHFNIKPNIECLKEVCKNKSLHPSIVSYFLDTHLILPDLECLGIAIKNSTIDIVREIYDKIENLKNNDKEIKENKENKKIKELGEGFIDFDDSEIENEETKLVKEKKETKLKKEYNSDDSQKDYDEEEIEDEYNVKDNNKKYNILDYRFNRYDIDTLSEFDEEEKPKLKLPVKKVARKYKKYIEESEESEEDY